MALITSAKKSKTETNCVSQDDAYWMQQALQQAELAAANNEVPVGAVIVLEGAVIAGGHNQPILSCDPSAHAEIIALRQAGQQLKNYRLKGVTLYVTLEPCAMCVGAMIQARVQRVVFGAADPRAGALSSVFQLMQAPELNHHFEWRGGVLAEPCANLLKYFFRQRRAWQHSINNDS